MKNMLWAHGTYVSNVSVYTTRMCFIYDRSENSNSRRLLFLPRTGTGRCAYLDLLYTFLQICYGRVILRTTAVYVRDIIFQGFPSEAGT